ncbi:MAG: DEAD/DEAH box helicase family protein [Rhodovibrio sp.]|nr:DEAD/DEAH box helicase family protein [Rhodovibrio sp.]
MTESDPTSAPLDNPILNTPFQEPERHHQLNEDGSPTGIVNPGRRPSVYMTPVPPPKKRTGQSQTAQDELALGDSDAPKQEVRENTLINEVRRHVSAWRALPPSKWGVTHPTERLLRHWREAPREKPFFFCQLEAVETIIWLTEVAPKAGPKDLLPRLEAYNADANPDLFRLALKMATGSGKTTVMAMLIAWQAVNKARQPRSRTFVNNFLVVTPGITIRDRLRVLLPSDRYNYYENSDVVPRDMLDDVRKARIVITNYHAFKLREKFDAPNLTKKVIGGRRGPKSIPESEGEMVRRVCGDLMRGGGAIVLNDEAHHCYRERPDAAEARKLSTEEKAEAKRNQEAARLWINGVEAVNRQLGKDGRGGVKAVYDLSATPFFLRGSGYPEGRLFPWVVSDFSLMDAIECGIVKVPRVPVSDNQVGGWLPVYRNLYAYIQQHSDTKLPKQGLTKQRKTEGGLSPDSLPPPLTGAMQALYGHYQGVFTAWEDKGHAVPPVFIVVCNNTSTSRLVRDHIAGYEQPNGHLKPGALPLFSNVDEQGQWRHRPRTILIDSEQLESGESLSADFKKLAAGEIAEFKRDLRERFPERDAEAISEEDLLREVMNTVGKPGRLGEQVRCVVSVSMLTEGWDANTVTHILGVRAFGTQLLCEQVVGRALRRVNYEPGKDGRLSPEYAEVLGVPFTFVASQGEEQPSPPPTQTRVEALSDRQHLEVRFPRVAGYRIQLPDERLEATFNANHIWRVTPDEAPSKTELEAVVGEQAELNLDRLKQRREQEAQFYVASRALQLYFKDGDDQPKWHLFPHVLRITKTWFRDCLATPDTFPQYLLWQPLADKAAGLIHSACVPRQAGREQLRPILDPYNREGSSRHVGFMTAKTDLMETRADKCHVNFVVCDSDWEAGFAHAIEELPEVLAYVKNHNLGFEIPYHDGGEERRYRPDFIVHWNDGDPDDPLNLIVEIKGFRGIDAQIKAEAAENLWCQAVNNHGGFGRWAFLEIRDRYDIARTLRDFVASCPAPRTTAQKEEA